MSPPYTITLTAEAATNSHLTGGKGANLATLAGSGLAVPPGFCVTTAAFDDAVADSDVPGLVADLDAQITATERTAGDETGPESSTATVDDEDESGDLADQLRTAIRDMAVPPAVRSAIEDSLDAFDDDDRFVARSSATAEDLPGASFAGQHETVLNVAGVEGVLGGVRECWASLFTDRAVAYRTRNGIAHGDVSMAVVVQRLVSPEASGICFTADPVSGDRSLSVIEAGYGLGETQVSGAVTADTARVDERAATVVDYRVGEKRVAVEPRADGRTETVEVPAADRARRVLTDEQALTLVALGERVEALFGAPQDLEWALVDDGFVLLQARTITALFPVPAPTRDGALRVYYSFGHRQGMPEAMPPLVVDYWRRLTDEVMAEFGLAGSHGAAAGGRVYVDVTPYLTRPWLREKLFERLESIDEPMVDGLRDLVARRGDELPEPGSGVRFWTGTAQSIAAGLGPRVGRMLLRTVQGLTDPDPLSAPERIREFYAERTRVAIARVRAPGTQAARIEAAERELVESLSWLLDAFYPFYAAMIARHALGQLCPTQGDDVEALVRGIETDVVTEMTIALDDVATVAREHQDVADAIRDGEDYERVIAQEGGAAFEAALGAFLDEYGFRAIGEIDLSRPRYSEDPSLLLGTIRGRLTGDGSTAHGRIERLQTEAAAAKRRLVAGADTGVTGPVKRRLVGRLAAVYRGYFGIRELPKFGLSPLLAETRRQVIAAGETLAERGQLDDPGDVWLLGFDELIDALEDETTTPAVAERRRIFQRYRSISAPRFVTNDGEVPRLIEKRATESGELRGTAASAGVVEGVARIVTDPSETTLDDGEILVAPYVDPGWTPLFLNAAGLVTEVGGRLTHGSLVAREYGIPAVVAVDGATTEIESGQRIRVDGTRGVVERLE